MNRKKLASSTEAELVALFREYAIKQESFLLDSNTAAYNRLYDKIEAIDDELKSRGMEARKSLLALLSDENFRVRYAAAVRSLVVDRERALAAIHQIAESHKMPEAGEAGMTLYYLEEGIFKPT